MAPSVKLYERTKSRLEELQAEIKRKTGKKVTQQDLLEIIVDHALISKDEVVAGIRENDEWDGLSPE